MIAGNAGWSRRRRRKYAGARYYLLLPDENDGNGRQVLSVIFLLA